MSNYNKSELGKIDAIGRVTLNALLNLTGSEISVNNLPAGVSVPFVHAHKMNEEVYVVLSGKGTCYIDNDEFAVSEGSVLKIDPQGARCLKAADDSALSYICIQTKANSLTQFTENDGYGVDVKPSWA